MIGALTYDEYVDAVAREAAGIVDVIRRGDPDTRVPTCPAWSLTDLAAHIGAFCVWSHVLCEGTGRPKPPFAEQPAEGGPTTADWLDGLLGPLVDELRATPPDTEVWTWVTVDKSARFIARRAAHELSVHRYDAQLALGEPKPIDAPLAADGIDEMFLMRNDAETAAPHVGSGETMHLHTTEGGEWMVTLAADRIGIERAHGKGDLALRGDASDIELLLYQRPTMGEVERFGDSGVLDVWYREFVFD